MKKADDQKQNDKQDLISVEEFEKLQMEFSNLKELSSKLDGQLKRAVADYQNLEKRVEQGRSELSNWASTELIKKMLPTLDHLEKALKGASEEERKSGWFKGVELAVQQLLNVLKSEGLDEIAADGQFDPALHEAVDTRVGEDNKILEVAERGYTLNGKVLKPAKVIVGRKE
ncbi:nucleotide exchange factor GrpE [Candidatus Daviesbacteria bacterium]|nr:nucleotide exchange factor GrpE [Candidatus Daviesbacteria bacterium]